VRRKDFWPLWHTKRLMHEYMAALAHETDGLILQGFEEYYKPGGRPGGTWLRGAGAGGWRWCWCWCWCW
jgi:hypothetical protein